MIDDCSEISVVVNVCEVDKMLVVSSFIELEYKVESVVGILEVT